MWHYRFWASIACSVVMSVVNAQSLTKKTEVAAPAGTHQLRVDYRETRQQMIERGDFRKVEKIVYSTEVFKPALWSGAKVVTARVFPSTWYLSADSPVGEMSRQGYRPANLEELLAFGREFVAADGLLLVVALGSDAPVNGQFVSPVFVWGKEKASGRWSKAMGTIPIGGDFGIVAFLGIKK